MGIVSARDLPRFITDFPVSQIPPNSVSSPSKPALGCPSELVGGLVVKGKVKPVDECKTSRPLTPISLKDIAIPTGSLSCARGRPPYLERVC